MIIAVQKPRSVGYHFELLALWVDLMKYMTWLILIFPSCYVSRLRNVAVELLALLPPIQGFMGLILGPFLIILGYLVKCCYFT